MPAALSSRQTTGLCPPLPYGDAVGVGVIGLVFSCSRAFAAFAVACCKRSESAFNLSVSGVLCGFTLSCALTVSVLSDFEQPAAARRAIDNITSGNFFMLALLSGPNAASNEKRNSTNLATR
jgi:hypothetical protein